MPAFSFKRSMRNTIRLHGLIKNRKFVWQMFSDAFRSNYSISFFTMVAIILSFIYIIFPFDLLPDFIPVIGWIDDGAVIYFLSQRILRETERYLKFRKSNVTQVTKF